MRHWSLPLSGIAAIFLGVALAVAAAPVGGLAKGRPIPPFSEVQQTVLSYFGARSDFQPGDLITRGDVEPLLVRLQQKGFPLADAKQILEKTPVKGEFLVDQLSTPNGRKFMRRIAAYPGGYDRLDQLSRLPDGQQTVRTLIRGPGGQRLIEYLTTPSGRKETGKMLSNSPGGERFNAPTGRIYTVAMLLARLQQSHAAALKAAAGKNGK